MIVSERMLFYARSRSLIHFRPISPGSPLFFPYPLLSSSSFAIPVSNPPIPPSPSVPIQAAQIFVKIGSPILTIEGLGQSVRRGFSSIILQYKEFPYPYFPSSDRMIGCIFYFTTGLHGIHVPFGRFGRFVIPPFALLRI